MADFSSFAEHSGRVVAATNDPADGNVSIEVMKAARAAHEVHRAFCATQTAGSPVPVQPPWERVSREQRLSYIDGVIAIFRNPALTPEDSHAGWMKGKERGGWKFGPVKDEAKKEHPCLVAHNQLPPEQRAKDALFGAVVRAVLTNPDAFALTYTDTPLAGTEPPPVSPTGGSDAGPADTSHTDAGKSTT